LLVDLQVSDYVITPQTGYTLNLFSPNMQQNGCKSFSKLKMVMIFLLKVLIHIALVLLVEKESLCF
jgi:hypothetical protein